MDNDANIPQMHGSESNVFANRVLRPVDVTVQTEMEDIWNHISKLDYCYDDQTEGDARIWLVKCMLPSTRLYRIGDVGVIQLEDITRVNATVHHALWGEISHEQRRKAMSELFDIVFNELKLVRLTTNVPTTNVIAKRTALGAGFKFEGCLRQFWLKQGKLYDVELYGILRSEYLSASRKV